MAAANNAEWCDLICRTHGIEGKLSADAWTSRARTPPLYPDAVTLVPTPGTDLLDRIDTSPGCTIKDSFASLDLTEHGFHVLFDSHWILRRPSTTPLIPASPRWSVVRDVEAFHAWERAWRGEEGPSGLLRPDLLRTGAVSVLQALVDDRVLAGAVLNDTGTSVGITNFFAEDSIAPASWRDCLALATSLFPWATLVGYESGRALEAVEALGFEAIGPLRVWIRDA